MYYYYKPSNECKNLMGELKIPKIMGRELRNLELMELI